MTTTTCLEVGKLEASSDNLRRKPRDGQRFKELVASVQALGVLEPLLVTPNGGERFVIVAGHRRYEAAKEAGLTTVPVHVRELTDAECTEVMLIENLQREDLSPTEEATGYLRLVGLGMTKKDLAKRIGRSVSHVSDRIRILDLPAKARRMVDAGDLPIGIVGDLLKLKAEDRNALLDEQPYDWERAIRNAAAHREREDRLDKARELAASSGVPVIEVDGYGVDSRKNMAALGVNYAELNVDVGSHRGEPCHALALLLGARRAVEVCTDPKRHTKKGASEIKAPTPSRSTANPDDVKHREEMAKKKTKAKERHEAVEALLGGKLPSDTAYMALVALVVNENATRQKATCKLLGVEPVRTKHSYGDSIDPTKPLLAYMTTPAKATKAALAMVVVLRDDAWMGGEFTKHVDVWLKANGIPT